MNASFKRIASALTAAILFSLCLTPTVFATEELPGSGTASIESAKESELSPATPSDTIKYDPEHEPLQPNNSGKQESFSTPAVPVPEPTENDALRDTITAPEDDALQDASAPSEDDALRDAAAPSEDDALRDATTPPPFDAMENVLPQPDTASTADELLEWLAEHENGEGTLQLTADISLGDLIYMNASSKNITIDTGEFSIIAAGKVYFWCSGLTVRGQGGENGVLRAAGGGALSIGYMTIEAEEGFAVYQEEGGGLVLTQCALDGNAVRYAETPFVWEWKSSLAIVGPGQTAADVLPETVMSYDVNLLGQMSTEEVPVVWQLAGHEASQEQRLRFEAVGSTPSFASFSEPVCTIVYNDFPLTFTWIETTETDSKYTIKGDFVKPEERLPIDVTMEYSFDGEGWLPDTPYTVYEDDLFYFSLRKGKGEGCWDIQENPWLWLRVHWDDGGTHYYSNMLRFSGNHFDKGEDHGGNRGGGTDIIVPSEPPKPETLPPPLTSEPEAAPPPAMTDPVPGWQQNNGTDHTTSGEEAPTPKNSDGVQDGLQESSHSITLKPESSDSSFDNETQTPFTAPEQPSEASSEPAPSVETILPSDQADTLPPGISPVPAPKSAQDSKSTPAATDTAPGALPIAAGVAAITASIGGAALYLYPPQKRAGKRRLEKLQNIIKR